MRVFNISRPSSTRVMNQFKLVMSFATKLHQTYMYSIYDNPFGSRAGVST